MPYPLSTSQFKILFSLCIITVLVLCLFPANDFKNIHAPSGTDKIVHLFMYLSLSSLAVLGWGNTKVKIGLIFILLVLFGIGIEFLQGYFPSLHRSADAMDVVFNSLGAFLGLISYRFRRLLVLNYP